MRPINFRAWDYSSKKYRKVVEIDFSLGQVELYDDNGCGEWHFKEEVRLEQYTGLKDGNGTGIYEGDIVQNMNHSDIWGVVEYHETGFLIKSCGNTFGKYFPLTKSCNVLGDIHENPELLEAD